MLIQRTTFKWGKTPEEQATAKQQADDLLKELKLVHGDNAKCWHNPATRCYEVECTSA